MLGYIYELYNKYIMLNEQREPEPEPEELQNIRKCEPTTPPCSHKSTRFYYLSLFKNNDTISIHGLWPQYSLDSYPQYCKKVKFSSENLEPIKDKLNKNRNSSEGKNS